MTEGMRRCVPLRRGRCWRSIKNKNRPPSRAVANLLIKKNKLWQRKKEDPSLNNVEKYNKCIEDISLARNLAESEAEKNILEGNNLKALYKHIISRLTHKSGIAPLFDSDGTLHTADADKAEILNAYFVSVGTVDDNRLPPLPVSGPSSE